MAGSRGASDGKRQFHPVKSALIHHANSTGDFCLHCGKCQRKVVKSLDGLTDDVSLQAGSSIVLGTNGNTLTISAAIGSDRNLKTGFTPVDASLVLDQLIALPLQSWRYLNEENRVHHIGPMAQDFKTVFGLGSDDKTIGLVDADGVALAAI